MNSQFHPFTDLSSELLPFVQQPPMHDTYAHLRDTFSSPMARFLVESFSCIRERSNTTNSQDLGPAQAFTIENLDVGPISNVLVPKFMLITL